jgi:lipoyl(octanoyl) transferase
MGVISYARAWEIQEALLAKSVHQKVQNRDREIEDQERPENYLLFCEHAPVYTLGKSGNPENLLLSEKELAQKGIEYYPNNRGGDITYHGPGQITGYPIFDLEQFTTDINIYLRNIEEAIILTLRDYGVTSSRYPGLTGVWIEPETAQARKICAIGIRCSRWVTMHGFAFNVNTDLSYFSHIIPCGIEDKGVTSLQQEIGHKLDLEEVKEAVRFHMSGVFGYDYALLVSDAAQKILNPIL